MTMPDISRQIWEEKYRYRGEADWAATCARVCGAIYGREPELYASADSFSAQVEAQELMEKKLWMPAGRIIAGAGTDRNVTLINCFVSPTLQDSFETDPTKPGKGIFDTLAVSAYTMKSGGGIGVDFSPLRPKGGAVRLGSKDASTWSSGAVSYMDLWNEMSKTVTSAGNRRGAMMATLRCDHPDILDFVAAKHAKGRLTEFNVSVLVTDAFMAAVKNDDDWHLQHEQPAYDSKPGDLMTWRDPDHAQLRVGGYRYKTLKARELWNLIMRSTYDHAEPGVIFIDRVNALNPLSYCETISCTNPCGEQPLPPNNVCNLGHVNLAKLVLDPFANTARVDYDLLRRVVACGVRFLDNVLDVTRWPTEDQREEALSKRRIGLGVTGLANLFQQMHIRYGSEQSVGITSEVMKAVAVEAYTASADLAEERGSFPAYNMGYHMQGKFFDLVCAATKSGNGIERLREKVRARGLRNGVLLSLAPTGTTSLTYDNVDGGIEPCFAHRATRRVRIEGDRYEERPYESWGLRAFKAAFSGIVLPNWMATAQELTPADHLAVQAAAQRWVDASISKTVNCPVDIDFEAFEHVYMEAYRLGCKGVTTYRPSGTRGAVLTAEVKPTAEDLALKEQIDVLGTMLMGEDSEEATRADDERSVEGFTQPSDSRTAGSSTSIAGVPTATSGKRPRVLPGRTYKVKVGDLPTMYVTINDVTFEDGRVGAWEIFLNASEQENHGWATGVARLLSRALRKGDDVLELAAELTQTFGLGGFYEGRYTASYVAAVADVLREHAATFPTQEDAVDRYWHGQEMRLGATVSHPGGALDSATVTVVTSDKPCPSCGQHAVVKTEGCLSCHSCGWSNCG